MPHILLVISVAALWFSGYKLGHYLGCRCGCRSLWREMYGVAMKQNKGLGITLIRVQGGERQ